MIARIATGWKAVSAARPIVKISSAVLNRIFENGSGLALAVMRTLAFVPWEPSAKPPPASKAAVRTAGSKFANAEAANTAPAGTRMKV
jgi:hypothetical protein